MMCVEGGEINGMIRSCHGEWREHVHIIVQTNIPIHTEMIVIVFFEVSMIK